MKSLCPKCRCLLDKQVAFITIHHLIFHLLIPKRAWESFLFALFILIITEKNKNKTLHLYCHENILGVQL